MSMEPCAGCGRETAAGSALFLSRRRGRHRDTDESVFVCATCAESVEDVDPHRRGRFLRMIEFVDIFRG
jgi:hypothetical protein